MKIAARDTDRLLTQPDDSYLIYLFYGPDSGLARQRSRRLASLFCDNLDDPFACVTLSGDQLAQDPVRLGDEAGALNIFGGLRLVRVSGSGTEMTAAVKLAAQTPNTQARIIIRATDVNTRHALVKFCDSEPHCASIGCYPDDSRSLSQLAHDIFARDNIKISPEAMSLITARLGGDRQASVSEIEKLALLNGPDSTLAAADIEAVLGDSAAVETDGLAAALLTGNCAVFESHFARLRREGVQPVAVIRPLLGLFKAMLAAKCRMQTGASLTQAVGQIRPPLHFRIKPVVSQQLARWDLQQIKEAVEKLVNAEIEAKSAAAADPSTLLGQTLLGLCLRARQLNRGR